MNIIDRILSLMDKLNISKADLYRLAGLKKGTLYNVFDTKTNPNKLNIETVRAIANALNTTLDYLISGDVDMIDKSSIDPNTGRRLHPLLVKYNKLNDDGRARVDAYLDDLIASGNYDDGDEICATIATNKKSLA